MGKHLNKAEKISEAILLGAFVIVASASSLFLLKFIVLTETAQIVIGYIMAGFAMLVFGYVVWKSVK